MFPKYAHRRGGRSRGAQEKAEALEQYYANPRICLQCGAIIEIPPDTKVSRINRRGRKFCSKACATTYNNLQKGKQ